MKILAGFLIIAGIAIVVWGITGFTTRETVVNIGPIHATRDKEHHVPYGSVAGAVIVLGGIVLLVKGGR